MGKYYWSIITIGDTRPAELRNIQMEEPKTLKDLDLLRYRTVGVFSELEQATAIAEKNSGDLCEAGWYNWLVIEKMPYGLYPIPEEIIWYEWIGKEDGCWRRIEGVPELIREHIKGICSVSSIG